MLDQLIKMASNIINANSIFDNILVFCFFIIKQNI